jgi:hypothetical protein
MVPSPRVAYLSLQKIFGILRTGWSYLATEYVTGVQKFSRNVGLILKVLGTSSHTENP